MFREGNTNKRIRLNPLHQNYSKEVFVFASIIDFSYNLQFSH